MTDDKRTNRLSRNQRNCRRPEHVFRSRSPRSRVTQSHPGNDDRKRNRLRSSVEPRYNIKERKYRATDQRVIYFRDEQERRAGIRDDHQDAQNPNEEEYRGQGYNGLPRGRSAYRQDNSERTRPCSAHVNCATDNCSELSGKFNDIGQPENKGHLRPSRHSACGHQSISEKTRSDKDIYSPCHDCCVIKSDLARISGQGRGCHKYISEYEAPGDDEEWPVSERKGRDFGVRNRFQSDNHAERPIRCGKRQGNDTFFSCECGKCYTGPRLDTRELPCGANAPHCNEHDVMQSCSGKARERFRKSGGVRRPVGPEEQEGRPLYVPETYASEVTGTGPKYEWNDKTLRTNVIGEIRHQRHHRGNGVDQNDHVHRRDMQHYREEILDQPMSSTHAKSDVWERLEYRERSGELNQRKQHERPVGCYERENQGWPVSLERRKSRGAPVEWDKQGDEETSSDEGNQIYRRPMPEHWFQNRANNISCYPLPAFQEDPNSTQLLRKVANRFDSPVSPEIHSDGSFEELNCADRGDLIQHDQECSRTDNRDSRKHKSHSKKHRRSGNRSRKKDRSHRKPRMRPGKHRNNVDLTGPKEEEDIQRSVTTLDDLKELMTADSAEALSELVGDNTLKCELLLQSSFSKAEIYALLAVLRKVAECDHSLPALEYLLFRVKNSQFFLSSLPKFFTDTLGEHTAEQRQAIKDAQILLKSVFELDPFVNISGLQTAVHCQIMLMKQHYSLP